MTIFNFPHKAFIYNRLYWFFIANIYIFFNNNYWLLYKKNIQCIWKENFIHIKKVDNTYFDKVFSPCLFIEHFLESALVFYLRLNLHKARITRIVKAYAKTCSNLQNPLSSIFTEHSHHSFLIFIKKGENTFRCLPR